jgi:hypothetical protein
VPLRRARVGMEVVGLLAGLTYTSHVLDAKGSCPPENLRSNGENGTGRSDSSSHVFLTDLARDEIVMMDTVSGRLLGTAGL